MAKEFIAGPARRSARERQMRYLSQSVRLEEAVHPRLVHMTFAGIIVAVAGFLLWAGFAKDGDPTGGALPAWPASADDALVIGVESSVVTAYDEEECDFWDTIPLG